MKFAPVLLAAAIGVSAHPSAHGHQLAHRSVEARSEFVMAKKPAPPAPPAPKSTPSPSPSPAPAPAPAPAPPKESPKPAAAPAAVNNIVNDVLGAVGQGLSSFTPFCTGSSKRATGAQIGYKGNTGTGRYGCNMMLVKSNIASQYKYTAEFTNQGSASVCYCWNKIGPDGGINGFFKGNQALTFNLAAGAKQVVAFDSNTQGACCCGEGSVALTSFGEFANTWVEYDFENESNGKWSGSDASALVPAKYNLNIAGLSVCYNDQCSIINEGGSGTNAYTSGTEALDGIGLNIAPGPVALKVIVNKQ